MTTCPTFYGVEDVALREVAENLQVLHQFADGWTDDDLISVFDEMIGVYSAAFLCWPMQLLIENVCAIVVSMSWLQEFNFWNFFFEATF